MRSLRAPSQDGGQDRVEFGRGQACRSRHGIEFGPSGSLERMQDEIDGLVERVMRAVAERKPGAA